MINFKTTRILIVCCLTALLISPTHAQRKDDASLEGITVLVYTKNGKGFIHDNIASSVAGLQQLGEKHRFKVDVSDNPDVFTEGNLKQYTLLIFTNTNNDVFDTDTQRLAFRRYIQAGGGFVGIHSVMGTERNWKWFKQLIGGTFAWHPKNQTYTVQIIKDHPSIVGLPKAWERKDECYFTKEWYPGINVVMAHNLTTLDTTDSTQAQRIKEHTGSFGELYPAVWHQQFDGGNMWLTTLGHDKENYQDPLFMHHILQGIAHVASQTKKLDFNRAYATSKDDPVRY